MKSGLNGSAEQEQSRRGESEASVHYSKDAVVGGQLESACTVFDLTCVINVRNGEKFLEQTLCSILRSCPIANVLVVDNHSIDGTAKILEQFPQVRTILTPKPCSLGAARNHSLEFVSSAYVTWLDADDQWLPDFFSCYAKAARIFPDAVMISSGSIIIDEQGRWLPPRRQRFLARELLDHMEVGDTLERFMKRIGFRDAWCSYVFKTDSVRKVGGVDNTFEFAEDVDLIGKLLTTGSGVHIDRNLTLLRYHSQQITRRLPPGKRSQEIMMALRNASNRSAQPFDDELATAGAVLQLKSAMQEFLERPLLLRNLIQLFSATRLRVMKWIADPGYLQFCAEQVGLTKGSRVKALNAARANTTMVQG